MPMPPLSEEPVPHYPNRVHHPEHFDFATAREVPDSHAWLDLHDYPSAAPSGPSSAPVIDLTQTDAVDLIAGACEEWGAFQLTGHGVPTGLLDRLEAQTRRLFELPIDVKLKAARMPDAVSGYGLAQVNSFFAKFMWSEGFTISGSPVDHARKLWPHDYRQFCGVVEEYTRVMKELAGRLLRVMMLSLGLKEEDINWAGPIRDLCDLSTVLHLNSYPPCPEPDRAIGLAEHTDSLFFTILYQGGANGLQVLGRVSDDPSGPAQWFTVPPVPGAFVVNVGDLMHILSNGRFRSVRHRAVVNRTRHRISAGFFCGPPVHVKVSPVTKLTANGMGRALYRTVTWAEYRSLKGKLFNRALESIKVTEEDGNSTSLIVSGV